MFSIKYPIIVFILAFLLSCREEPKKPTTAWTVPATLNGKPAIHYVIEKIYQQTLKKAKIEKKGDGFIAEIDFGGSTALTFLNHKNYRSSLFALTSLTILQTMKRTKKYNLHTIRASMIKPYYVKHTELKQEIIEEFEILRMKCQREPLEQIKNWHLVTGFEKKRPGEPTKPVYDILKQMPHHCQIELDETYRVEIK